MLMRPALLAAIAAFATPPALAQAAYTPAPPEQVGPAIPQLGAALLKDYATSPDNTEVTIIDRRVRVSVEGQDGLWYYSQLNTGADQSLYRQRFHQLDFSPEGFLIQRSFVPEDASRFVDGWDNPNVFAALTVEDMEPVLGDGCEQSWTLDTEGVWHGSVNPETCSMFSERRQAKIRIGADSYYKDGEHGTSERGFDEDMNPIWGSALGEYITLLPCTSPKCADEAQALAERAE